MPVVATTVLSDKFGAKEELESMTPVLPTIPKINQAVYQDPVSSTIDWYMVAAQCNSDHRLMTDYKGDRLPDPPKYTPDSFGENLD